MPDCQEIYERFCKNEFAEIKSAIKELDHAIRGNGKPGLQERIGTLEKARGVLTRLLWIAAVPTTGGALYIAWKLVQHVS